MKFPLEPYKNFSRIFLAVSAMQCRIASPIFIIPYENVRIAADFCYFRIRIECRPAVFGGDTEIIPNTIVKPSPHFSHQLAMSRIPEILYGIPMTRGIFSTPTTISRFHDRRRYFFPSQRAVLHRQPCIHPPGDPGISPQLLRNT